MFQCPFFGTHIHTHFKMHYLKGYKFGFSVIIIFWSHNKARKKSRQICKKMKCLILSHHYLSWPITLFVKHFLGVTYASCFDEKEIGYYIVTLIDYTTKLLLLLHKNCRSE
jgi:hypothetical protein